MSSPASRPRPRPITYRSRRQRLAAGAVLATTSLLGTYLAAIRPHPTYAAPNTGSEQGQGLVGSANVSANALTLPTCGQADDTVATEGALRAAILASDDTSVICITGKIGLTADLPTLDDTSVTFIGATDDSTAHGINGYTYYRGFVANFSAGTDDSLILSSLTVENTYADSSVDYGGGVFLSSDGSDYLHLNNVSLISNVAYEGGGAVYANDVRRATFSGIYAQGNHALDEKGGAIWIKPSSVIPDVTVTDSMFVQNVSNVADGGALAFSDGTVQVSNSTFDRNYAGNGGAGDNGGGIYMGGTGASSTLAVTQSTFSDDSATGDGGAIYVDNAEMEISNSTFSDNYAGDNGGAVKSDTAGRVVKVYNSTFESNRAGELDGSGDGGAIDAKDFLVRSSTFKDNYAKGAGGGVWVGNDADVYNTAFVNNSAATDGGGLWVGTIAQIFDSLFLQNDADDEGGGAFLDGDAAGLSTVANSSFDTNGDDTLPRRGGGLYFLDTGPLNVQNSTFIGNKAELGGGIFIQPNPNVDDTIAYTTITGNTATGGSPSRAGGLWAISNKIHLLNSIVSGNSTDDSWADAELTSNTGSIQNNLFGTAATTNDAGVNAAFGAPQLSAAGNNGGALVGDDSAYYLPTAIPAWNSPAVGLADPTLTPSITTTQIGTARVGNVAGAMNASAAPPTPTPTFPPSAPLNVTGTAGDASATITWTAPASAGSFPITDYQAVLSPGGATCLVQAPALSCTITGLTNGTEYTATARALNGAGWGPYSTPSEPFTPGSSPSTKTIVITGTRGTVKGRPGVYANGETTGLVGATVQARVKLAGQLEYRNGSTRIVQPDGTFQWQRKTGKKVYVYFIADDGQVRSNRAIIDAR